MALFKETLVEKNVWLKDLESPYFWKPNEFMTPQERPPIVYRLKEKEKRALEKTKSFTFNNFVLKLLLGYELYATAANSSAAMFKLKEVEEQLERLDTASNCSFYRQVRQAQWHVTLASEAILLAILGRIDESKNVISDSLYPSSKFNPTEKAAICGIKSRAFLEYGSKGWPVALKWAKEALVANPDEAEWHFLAGRAMEKIRLEDEKFTGIPKEEISCFEKAVTLSGKDSYSLHLARVYEQIVQKALTEQENEHYFTKSFLDQQVKEMTQRTVQLYRSTLRNTTHMENKLRSLEGLLRHPRQFLDYDEIKGYLVDLLKLPKKNKMFYDVAGKFYLKLEKDHRSAIHYFEQGSTLGYYPCSINVLRLRHKLRHNPDMEQSLRHLAERYQHHVDSRDNALSHLAAYYLFTRHDLAEALAVCNTVLNQNPTSKALLVHKPMFVRSPRPINLLSVIYNEVRTKVGQVSLDAKSIFYETLGKYHTALLRRPIDPYLMDKIFRISDKMNLKYRKFPKKRPSNFRGM